ncbi:sugar ABC transporter permease [Roseibium sp. CAU 1637]|uniref:Xylose transport system permease protein XylH n=1 Tax=Roseibium limicola TaxID=2816037 RepID=A0A939EP61_9HYPH|nr:sugar ABC transporter permease [Roseibium limicola]MBO0346360.1 sugar ABC transporter permease [Roseibium limicola]
MSDDTLSGAKSPTARNLFNALQLDTRLLGMIGAFVFICLTFQVFTGDGNIFKALVNGNFLTPRNIFNLTIQTVSVAIMATGMVFIIVTRHIDLSVGALLATCSAIMAVTQTQFMPQWLGFELGNPLIWIAAIAVGLLAGVLIGAFQGWMVGYLGIPAFIVTLGGLLVWRNVAWFITSGQTIGPLDETFKKIGGIGGTLGTTWSWVVGILAAIAVLAMQYNGRKRAQAHDFPTKPLWAEGVISGLMVAMILGFVATLNAYEIPTRRLERMFETRGEIMPDGLVAGYGIPYSVLLLIAVAVVMTIVAQRTRLGRYIFATGGNPDAAELSGINTRFLTVKVFAIMGGLCALGAVVGSARLGFSTNDIGTLDELRVIAAAVIGGTALAGGVGTIYGAILGALIMQSLQSGMAMVGVDAPLQNIVVGIVLVLAVFVDIIYRKRTGD